MSSTPGSTRDAHRPPICAKHIYKRHDDLVDATVSAGPRDTLSSSDVLDLLRALPTWPADDSYGRQTRRLAGATTILDWLATHPGSGWQDRWITSGADRGTDWLTNLNADNDTRAATT